MSTPAIISDLKQTHAVGYLELFEIDLSTIPGAAVTLYVTPASRRDAMVVWDGNAYIPAPIEAEGFEWGGQGAIPQPTLRVANVQRILEPWVWTTQDLLGATVTRTETLERFTDDGATPDTAAWITREVFQIEQKINHSAEAIEFRLVSPLDRDDLVLPEQQALGDQCQHRYREWTGTAWVYHSCPYNGSAMFDFYNASTLVSADDRCRKDLTACRLRFDPDPLETTAIPGVTVRR